MGSPKVPLVSKLVHKYDQDRCGHIYNMNYALLYKYMYEDQNMGMRLFIMPLFELPYSKASCSTIFGS